MQGGARTDEGGVANVRELLRHDKLERHLGEEQRKVHLGPVGKLLGRQAVAAKDAGRDQRHGDKDVEGGVAHTAVDAHAHAQHGVLAQLCRLEGIGDALLDSDARVELVLARHDKGAGVHLGDVPLLLVADEEHGVPILALAVPAADELNAQLLRVKREFLQLHGLLEGPLEEEAPAHHPRS